MMNDYTTASEAVTRSAAEHVRAPFAYYGAKQRLAKRVVELLPPHNAWVEGFCGSSALTLAKPQVPIEVINDWDGEIVNFFQQVRDNATALCRSVALTPYAYAELERARRKHKRLTKLERARRFLVGTMMTINGTPNADGNHCGFSFSQSYAREGREARVNRWYNLPERLEAVVERLRSVRIENRDARELIAMFADRPASLMYLDPPYFTKRGHGYVIDANDREFHEELLRMCVKARCMILLSGYDNPLYQKILVKGAKWSKRRIETHTRDTTGVDYARTEILWMNRQFVKAKRRDAVPIRLSRKERAENKINPPRRR